MLLLPVLLLTLQGASAPQTIDSTDAWNKLSKAIQDTYYARKAREQEMDNRLKEYAPLAEATHTKAEFRDVAEKMIAEFKDSHFDFYSDEDQGYYLMDGFGKSPASMPEIGAWFKRTGDVYTVQMVLEGMPAADSDIRKGDVVTEADGKPFQPVLSLQQDLGKSADLTILRAGQSLHKQVKVASEPAIDMFLDATMNSARVINDGKKKIGYVHLWAQISDKFSSALSRMVYGTFKDTDAMILDLRDGFGGRPENYSDPFFRPGIHLDWKFSGGETPQLFGYDRPLVVLINGGSRSAKEVLAYIFKKSRRAVLMGSNTAGNVLGTTPRRLTPWAYVEIPIAEVYADGIRLEGRGVAPDIALPQEIDSTGKDLYLAAALNYLKGK